MSISRLEADVMDRWEAGMSIDAIAAELGVRYRSVECVIGYMRTGKQDLLMTAPALTRSSDSLAAAIARHHPEKLQP